jgi:hypothetical protein
MNLTALDQQMHFREQVDWLVYIYREGSIEIEPSLTYREAETEVL